MAQVAQVTGYKPETVRQWLCRGHLARDRWGRIDPLELLTYLDQRGQRGQHTAARRRLARLAS